MDARPTRIAASSYSNTAPLVWSFLYGSLHGKVELVLDNAPARSAELLATGRVDVALTPVIAYQMTEGVRLVPNVCVGAKESVRSVCLVTRVSELNEVRSVALDVSSRTSVCLTRIIFKEFLGFEPKWREARPNIDEMLSDSDCALLIGDPALQITSATSRAAEMPIRTFDLAQLWHSHTGLGFVFAMWMSATVPPVDLAAVRDEGLEHIDEIAANYTGEIGLSIEDLKQYLTSNISYSVDESMQAGLELYFELAFKHGLIEQNKRLDFAI